MENASKALIIAGAILLAILLISLGIMIYNQAQEVVTGSGMDEAAKTAFNSKFLKYEGKQKGTMVKALIQEVLANNTSENAQAKVKLKGAGNPSETEAPITSGVVRNTTYTVKLTYTNGLVSQIDLNP